MEVTRRVFFVGRVGLVRPVDANFLVTSQVSIGIGYMPGRSDQTYNLVDTTPIQSGHGTFGRTRIIVLDKAIIETLRLKTCLCQLAGFRINRSLAIKLL